MSIFKHIAMAATVGVLSVTTPLHAASNPRSGQVDHRMKVIEYNENDIVNVRGHYRYLTMIEFAKDELITAAILGDSAAWKVEHDKNLLFLKPVLNLPSTNMIVLTDKRKYNFSLTGRRSNNHSNVVYGIKFEYPEDEKQALRAAFLTGQESVVTGDVDHAVPAEDLNFNYSYVGKVVNKPKRVFDDGKFTYIEFAENASVPAVFFVNELDEESLVNTSMKGNYLVIPQVTTRLSLRNGQETLCLFNDKLFTVPPSTTISTTDTVAGTGSVTYDKQ